ncbi:unnamed protein product [Effrenium voratum]|nr:unnamed protein product [Effrenium voratum]
MPDRHCDGGQMFRERRVLSEAHSGGQCAAHTLKQAAPCNLHPCQTNENDCVLSQWSSWSDCTAQCEKGTKKRHREIQQRASEGGRACKNSMMEVESCEGPGCESRDCVWGAWDSWSGCSCSCGGGTMRRNRQVQVSPVAGGELCDPVDKSEAAPCNTFQCQETCIDARWAGLRC